MSGWRLVSLGLYLRGLQCGSADIVTSGISALSPVQKAVWKSKSEISIKPSSINTRVSKMPGKPATACGCPSTRLEIASKNNSLRSPALAASAPGTLAAVWAYFGHAYEGTSFPVIFFPTLRRSATVAAPRPPDAIRGFAPVARHTCVSPSTGNGQSLVSAPRDAVGRTSRTRI